MVHGGLIARAIVLVFVQSICGSVLVLTSLQIAFLSGSPFGYLIFVLGNHSGWALSSL